MNCPPTESLFENPALRVSDHVRSCPRCAARLRALDEFLAPGASPDGVSLAEVERELRQRLAADVRSRQAGPARSRLRAPLRARYFGLLAAAAVVLAVLWWRPMETAETPTVRSTAPLQTAKLRLSETSLWTGLRLQLAWNAVEGAERYLVIVYDSKLRELASQEVAGRESCEFVLSDAGSEPSLWVRVRALRAGGLLEDSGLQLVSGGRR